MKLGNLVRKMSRKPSFIKGKKILDDEVDRIRKDLHYFSKRGTLYDQEGRTIEEVEERSRNSKRKDWKEVDRKWKHDLFVEYEQSPKTCEELVATYGYDIRNEEGTHRARRHRSRKEVDRSWKHDLFVDTEQLPKTRKELVATYGYDIRNEEGTHRARWIRRDPKKHIQNLKDFGVVYPKPSRGSGGVSLNSSEGGGGGGGGGGVGGSERATKRRKRHSLTSEEEFPALVSNNGSSKVAEEDKEQINYVPTVEIKTSNGRNEDFNRMESMGRGRSFVRRGGKAESTSLVFRFPRVASQVQLFEKQHPI